MWTHFCLSVSRGLFSYDGRGNRSLYVNSPEKDFLVNFSLQPSIPSTTEPSARVYTKLIIRQKILGHVDHGRLAVVELEPEHYAGN